MKERQATQATLTDLFVLLLFGAFAWLAAPAFSVFNSSTHHSLHFFCVCALEWTPDKHTVFVVSFLIIQIMPYYAVAKGRSTGVYKSWGDCENQVKGYSGATFKKFDSASSAQEFLESQGGGSSYSSNSSHYDSGSSSYDQSSYSSNHFGNAGGNSRGGNSFERDRDGYYQVYTDGACLGNGRDGARAGIGVYWGPGNPLNTSEPVSGRHTNNSGEIQAATRAMKQAADNGIQKLTINTDSKFLIKSGTEWMPGNFL